jgi:hypothetical protein
MDGYIAADLRVTPLPNTGLHAGVLPRYLDRQTKPRY